MSGTDIHPEDLLDKMAAGTLSEAEQAHLTAHLEDCEVCRFTLEVQADLQLEATGLEFGRVSAQRLLRLSNAPPTPVAGSPRRPRRAVLVAAGVFALASGAAALVGSRHSPFSEASLLEPSVQPPRVLQARTRPRGAAEAVESTPQSQSEKPPQQAPEPSSTAAVKSASAQRATSTPAPSTSTPAGAAELFASANQARRNGDAARAIQLYHTLQQRFPASSEAELSLVTLGRLHLDRGNTGAALSTFNRYLARGGRPLEAEALYGRALALGRLGLSAEEQKAWQALVNQHPGSGYANKARERLRALAAR